MAFNLEELGIHQLSVQDRLLLIEQIWESLPEEIEPGEVPQWHRDELARRRSQIQPDSPGGRPWRDVMSSLEDGR